MHVWYDVAVVELGGAAPAADDRPLGADVTYASMLAVGGSSRVAGAAEGEVIRGNAAGVNRPLYNLGAMPAEDSGQVMLARAEVIPNNTGILASQGCLCAVHHQT